MTETSNAPSDSPKQPNTLKPEPNPITTVGVDLDSDRASIGGDIVGRDKVVNNNIHFIVQTTSCALSTGDDQVAQRALAMARRALAVLEEQAAGYGKLNIPAHLQIELEEKRLQVAELESRVQLSAR